LKYKPFRDSHSDCGSLEPAMLVMIFRRTLAWKENSVSYGKLGNEVND
jgi:hypothetical protein